MTYVRVVKPKCHCDLNTRIIKQIKIYNPMMKKSLLAFATIALTTGAWGETVQHLGVTYTLTSASGTYTNPETSTDNRVLNTAGATSGELTYSGNLYQDSTATVEQGVNATSLYLATPTFEAWSETNESTVNKRQNGSFYPGDSKYASEMQRLIGEGEPLFKSNQLTRIKGIYGTMKVEVDPNEEGISSEDFTYDSEKQVYTYTTVDGGESFTYYWNGSDTYYYYEYAVALNLAAFTAEYIYDVENTYFYRTKIGTKYYYYAIEKYTIDVTTIINTTTTTNYTPTTIPSGLNWSSVTSFTIGASIETIASNAFNTNTEKIGDVNVAAGNAAFVFDNNILSDINEEQIILVSKVLNNTIVELPNSFTSVRPYATYYRSNITFYWTSSVNEFSGADTDQGSGVAFYKLGGIFNLESTGTDGGMKVPNGAIISTNEQLSTLITNNINNATYLDFRTAEFRSGVSLTNKINYNNKIIIVDETSPIHGINVVYFSGNKFVCDQFQLSDTYKAQPFFSPITFTATKASYDRVIGVDYSSICLPFNVRYVAGNPRFMVGTLNGYDSENNVFSFINVKNDLTANTPYFIYATNGEDSFDDLENVTIEATPATPNNVTINGASLCGALSRTELDGNNDTYAFYGFASGSLVHVSAGNKGYVNTFRAYLQTPKGNLKPNSGASTIRFINESETAIENVKENKNVDNEAIYNLNGQRVSGINANGIYVKNGKKIIVK